MRRATATLILAAMTSASAWAHPIAGEWTTFDDESGRASAVVRVDERAGQLVATVVRILDAAKADRVCAACSDDRKNQPIQGMQIVRSVPAQAVAPGTWRGGSIVDPKTGKTYDVQLKLIDQAQALEVRGYLGLAMLGRSQRWVRTQRP